MGWNEKKLQDFQSSVLMQLEEMGFDTSKIKLDVVQFIDEQHQDCLWYGGQVASVRYKGFLFSLEARGDIDATLLDENDNELCWSRDKINGGGFYEDMEGFLEDDNALHTAKENGVLVLENNNWFEIFVQDPYGNWLISTDVCNDDDLRECVIEMIDGMDLAIDDYAKGLDPKGKDRDLLARLALEHFGYDGALALQDDYCVRHLDAFIAGYRDGVELIDMDFWVQYEDLLGESMSYEEYVFVDSLYEGDPLELIDVELTGVEQQEFAELRSKLFEFRASKNVDSLIFDAGVRSANQCATQRSQDLLKD